MSEKRTRKTWSGKSHASGIAYSLHHFFLRYTGIHGAYFILIFVAAYFFLFDRISNRVLRQYYRRIHGFSAIKSFMYRYRTYFVFGQCLLDKVAILEGRADRYDIQFDGHAMLMEMAAAGKGCMVISAHIGNWEIAGQYLKNANTPVNVVMYDIEHETVKNALQNSLKNRNFKLIPISADYSHLLQIKKAISNHEFICMHGDRLADPDQTKRAKKILFFGRNVWIPTGPFELIKRYRIPYVFVFANRARGMAYRFKAFRPDPDLNYTVDEMIEYYVRRMEDNLRRYPEQWFNFYDYWRFDEERKD